MACPEIRVGGMASRYRRQLERWTRSYKKIRISNIQSVNTSMNNWSTELSGDL
jgi:hypothetical protein